MPIKEIKSAAVAGLFAVLVFYLPAFLPHPGNLGFADSDQSFFYVESMRKALQDYGELPMWDPWHMGGMPLIGNPQSVLSPLFFPVLFFGTVIGLKLAMMLTAWVGFMGVWLFGRKLGLENPAALCAGLVWSLSGLHAIQLQAGWFLFCHLHLMPLIAFCLLMAEEDWKWTAPAGLCMALVFFGGSPYPLSVFLPFFAIFAVGGAVREKSFKPIFPFMGAALLAVLITSVKLFPVLSWMGINPRHTPQSVEGFSPTAFAHALLDHRLDLQFRTPLIYGGDNLPGTTFYMAPEYGMYLGPVAVLLVVAGFMLKMNRRAEATVALLVFLFLAMGDYSPVPLSTWLREFPVYDSMRVVTRFRWPLVFLMAVFAGAGAQAVVAWIGGWKKAYWIIAALVAFNLFAAGLPLLMSSFPVPAEKVLPAVRNETGMYYQRDHGGNYDAGGWVDGPKTVLEGVENGSFPFLLRNIGITLGYEPFGLEVFARGMGSPDYHGEAFIFSRGGFVGPTVVAWSPNRVDLRWQAGVEGELYLNQNYLRGWGVCGDPVRKLKGYGLVGMAVGPEETNAAFCYEEPHIGLYAAISAISLAATLGFCFFAFRRQIVPAPGLAGLAASRIIR